MKPENTEPEKQSEQPSENEPDKTPKRWKRWLIPSVKLVVFGLVVLGITRMVMKSLDQFEEKSFAFGDIDFRWFAVCGLFYLLGMAPAWFFWHRTLLAMGQQPTYWESFRAFYLSQLGKYVPGKAMVVLMRAADVKSDRTSPLIAGVAVFVETLTMMAVGACIAAVILSVWYSDQLWLVLLAIGLMFCAATPTIPPLFRRVVKTLQGKRRTPATDKAVEGVTWKLMAQGWVIDSVGWLLMGMSLWAALQAVPGTELELSDARNYLLLTACVSLACVAGFLSLIPAGAGVRDAIVIALVGMQFGEVPAIVSAVIMRLASLVFELGLSAILYSLRWWKPH